MLNLLLLITSLFIVIKSADFAVKYSYQLAPLLRLPKYVIGFLIVALISILPETFVAISSAMSGLPAFGLGTLFGSNVADLTLIFSIVTLASTGGIKINSKILHHNKWFPFILAVPIILGLDGYYSRLEGIALILTGIIFYFVVFNQNKHSLVKEKLEKNPPLYYIFLLLLSIAGLILGSWLTVKYGVAFAQALNINPVLVAMFIVGLGTTLPELFFSLRAGQKNQDELALGDILGTVVSDATIVVGIIALISPFDFPTRIIYVTAIFMLLASFILFGFLRSDKVLSKKEAIYLLIFYLIFICTEYLINK